MTIDSQFIKRPCLLVLHESEGGLFFVINNDDELFARSEIIVNTREHLGWYASVPAAVQAFATTAPEMSREEIEKLPEGKVRLYALGLWKNYEKEFEQWQIKVQSRDLLNRALHKGGRSAWVWLRSRAHVANECVTIEKISTEY